MNLTDIQRVLLAAIIDDYDRAVMAEFQRYGLRTKVTLAAQGIGVLVILTKLRLNARPLRALAAKGAIRLTVRGRKVTPETSAYLSEFRAAPTKAGRMAIS